MHLVRSSPAPICITKITMVLAKRTVLITGCSDGGLGCALAIAFHKAGWRVFATARNTSKLTQAQSSGIETLQLDTVSDSSISSAVSHVQTLTGGSLDMLLNNAGAGYSLMPLLDIDMAKAKTIFDLNVWSLINVTRAFLPLLLASTHPAGAMVVNNTSVASLYPATMPWSGVYSASKAAAASITETLRLELEPFGIKVVNLMTGAVKSGFGEKLAREKAALPPDFIYNVAKEIVESRISAGGMPNAEKMDPMVWAARVVGDLSKRSPSYWIFRGKGSTFIWVATLLPVGLFDRMIKKITGLDEVKRIIGVEGAKGRNE